MAAIETLPIDQIDRTHLDELVRGRAAESRTLEFKQALQIHTDVDKDEFRTDVAAFANAAGGLLIAGIRAENGEAVEVVGTPGQSADDLQLRIDSILRTNIEPRLPGWHTRAFEVTPGRFAVLVRVARSFTGTHGVGRNGTYRFAIRGSSGKLPLDIPQVRSSFQLAEGMRERLRRLREERTGRILAGEGIVPLRSAAQVIMHLVPLSSLGEPVDYNLAPFYQHSRRELAPVGHSRETERRYNLDGLLATVTWADATEPLAYVQLHQNAIVETVDTHMLTPMSHDERFRDIVSAPFTQNKLIEALQRYLVMLADLHVDPPVYLMVTMAGTRNRRLAFSNYDAARHAPDRDLLSFPEVVVDRLDAEPTAVLRPVFDALWRAFGSPCCQWYDPNTGAYKPPP